MPVDLKKLTAPFPREALKTRRGGGGKALTYVEGHTVIHRLNDACGDEGWSFAILKEWRDGDILKALVELTLPGLGSRQHIGVQKIADGGGEDLHKGAVTDGLKKAATLFGVGLELYGPDYGDDAEPARSPTPAGQTYTPRETPRQQAERDVKGSDWLKARDQFLELWRACKRPTEPAHLYAWITGVLERDVRAMADCTTDDLKRLWQALSVETAGVPV